MEILRTLIDLFLHLDAHVLELVNKLGPWTYLLLFLVLFCETGLVVTPFLPGDSLLFAVGAVIALPSSPLNLSLMMALLIIAAILGDAVNYYIGKRIGPRVFRLENSWFFNKKHLEYTQKFYEKHGGKTIILARFIPIARTFAPFVAGIGRMHYRRFASYNVVGAILWVIPFLVLGYIFGNLPVVRKNFHYVILAIIIISVSPAAFEILKSWRNRGRPAQPTT